MKKQMQNRRTLAMLYALIQFLPAANSIPLHVQIWPAREINIICPKSVHCALDARCPKCGEVATVNEQMSRVECSHCGYGDGYDEYLETMKDEAINMAADYIPDRPGM